MRRKLDILGTVLALLGLAMMCVALGFLAHNAWLGVLTGGAVLAALGLLICRAVSGEEGIHGAG